MAATRFSFWGFKPSVEPFLIGLLKPKLHKSYYLLSYNCHFVFRTKYRSLLQGTEDVHVPGKTFRKSSMCDFCNNLWMYGRCHVSVMPRKVPGKKMKKVIQKQELSQALRPLEKKLFEKYKKEKDNKMVRVIALGSSMFTLLKRYWALKFCSCKVWRRGGGGGSCCRT